MDQDAFRKLLSTSGLSQNNRSSFTLPPKKTSNSASLSSFQPRRLDINQPRSTRKNIGADREAVPGIGYHDPTDKLLENKSQDSDAVPKDGHPVNPEKEGNGEEEHPIMVKGLDFALLEKTKSQLNTQTEDDALEATFQESQKLDVPNTKKRTREDLIRALKEKKAGLPDTPEPESSASAFEKAKQLGKFKPIGAPDTSTRKDKPKRKAGDREAKPRKKKAVEGYETEIGISAKSQDGRKPIDSKPVSHTFSPPAEEVDIFADAEEYKGLELDEEEEENEDATDNQDANTFSETQKNDWFKDENISSGEEAGLSRSPGPTDLPVQPPSPSPPLEQSSQPSSTVAPARLEPLASSSIPSIRDFLQMDELEETHEKRRARKKRKDNKERGNEDKLNRDYQRLNSYVKNKKT